MRINSQHQTSKCLPSVWGKGHNSPKSSTQIAGSQQEACMSIWSCTHVSHHIMDVSLKIYITVLIYFIYIYIHLYIFKKVHRFAEICDCLGRPYTACRLDIPYHHCKQSSKCILIDFKQKDNILLIPSCHQVFQLFPTCFLK